jgi:hypothetical protein
MDLQKEYQQKADRLEMLLNLYPDESMRKTQVSEEIETLQREMGLQKGRKLMIYSRSQKKLCPAIIIGLPGEIPRKLKGGKIPTDCVEIQYLPPCPSIIKYVNISELKFPLNPCVGVRDGTWHPGCQADRPICMKNKCSERTVESARERRVREMRERRMGRRREMVSIEEEEEGEDMDLKGAEVMIYSISQEKLCPAIIIGLPGDYSINTRFERRSVRIPEDCVEIRYTEPCRNDVKIVRIGDLKYSPSSLPSPPGSGPGRPAAIGVVEEERGNMEPEPEGQEDMEPEPEGQSEEERMEAAKAAFKRAMGSFLTRTTESGALISEREYLDQYSARDVAMMNDEVLSIYNDSYEDSPWGRALFDRMWKEEVSRLIARPGHHDDEPDEPGTGGGFRRKNRKSKKRKTRKNKPKKRKRSRRKSKTKRRR